MGAGYLCGAGISWNIFPVQSICNIRIQGAKDHAFRCFRIARACLKNHFRNLQAPLCGIFYLRSVAVARYAALIRINDYK